MIQSLTWLMAGVLCYSAVAGASSVELQNVRGDEAGWQLTKGHPQVAWQSMLKGAQDAIPLSQGEGSVYRCLVEPVPGAGTAGIALWSGKEPDLRLVLDGGSEGGIALFQGANDSLLWSDRYAPWRIYSPYWIELVVEPGRVRAQMLEWDAKTLVAQSEWIDIPGLGPSLSLGLSTRDAQARFYRWARVNEPFMPIVDDSPTRLRLANAANPGWSIVGTGHWMWTDANKTAIRQGRVVERTTAMRTSAVSGAGVERCRIRIDAGAGGAGMIVHGTENAGSGYLAWLGGTPGNGSLMLYRLPLEALWASPDGQWQYDTDYILETTSSKEQISVRLLAADGSSTIAESPAITLKEGETTGYAGYMTWHGTATFGLDGVSEPVADATLIHETGGWQCATPESIRVETSADGMATMTLTAENTETAAINPTVSGSRSLFRAHLQISPGTAEAAYLFQAEPVVEPTVGFACVFGGDGLELRQLGVRTLWRFEHINLNEGWEGDIEGSVVTDRVRLRLLDGNGVVLGDSGFCYISASNNAREGCMGLRVKNGTASISNWQATPSNE